MSIFSFSFGCFLLSLGVLYFLFPKKLQWWILLAGNLVFYSFAGTRYLIYLISCAFFTWFAALKIEKNSSELAEKLSTAADKDEKKALRLKYNKMKRNLIIAALIPTLGVWIVLKYCPFLVNSVSSLFSDRHLSDISSPLHLIVPLGMSFYTFDAIGYMIDVSRNKYEADANFFHYLTFLSFFPHIIQGPFSRYDRLGETLFAEHRFSYDRLCRGLSRILWGYFKKLIIADKLAVTVNEIFSNYENYRGIQTLLVIVLYGIQIYADFSGYMDIASGVSHVLGISLEKNFDQPYFAVSVEDFWRRWHMTLGHWFRDYMFYPIAMSTKVQAIGKKTRMRFGPRAGKLITSGIASFWVWSATGLWHGASWTFLVWGWLNMIVMIFSQVMDPWYVKARNFFHISLENKLWHLFRIFRTFCLVCFFRFFSRADSIKTALLMLGRITQGISREFLTDPMCLFPQMRVHDVFIVLAAVIVMTAADILSEKGKWDHTVTKTNFLIRNAVYVLMIVSLILFAGSGEDIAKGFMYANY